MSDIMDMDKADMAAELSKLRKEIAEYRDQSFALFQAETQNKVLKQTLREITRSLEISQEYL